MGLCELLELWRNSFYTKETVLFSSLWVECCLSIEIGSVWAFVFLEKSNGTIGQFRRMDIPALAIDTCMLLSRFVRMKQMCGFDASGLLHGFSLATHNQRMMLRSLVFLFPYLLHRFLEFFDSVCTTFLIDHEVATVFAIMILGLNLSRFLMSVHLNSNKNEWLIVYRILFYDRALVAFLWNRAMIVMSILNCA